jgi:hypothetical protein
MQRRFVLVLQLLDDGALDSVDGGGPATSSSACIAAPRSRSDHLVHVSLIAARTDPVKKERLLKFSKFS